MTEAGFLRLNEILANYIPVCRTRWYAGVRAGEFPKPVKMGKVSFWRREDILKKVQEIGEASGVAAPKASKNPTRKINKN
jgi:Predicted transcriptional regulator